MSLILTKTDYNAIADAFDELTIRTRQACALSEIITAAAPALDDDGDTIQTTLGLLTEILEANDATTVSLQKQLLNLRLE